MVGKIFLDPGDHVVLEDPSYLGAIQAFDAYQTRYLTVDTDEEGLIPESLERVLDRADPFPKFLYLVPNFQNPTGRTLSGRAAGNRRAHLRSFRPANRRRRSVLRAAVRRRTILPPLIAHERPAPIIYFGTGSKIMAPGMRIAWLVIPDEDIREKIVLAKQGADLHSGTFAQYVFHEYATTKRPSTARRNDRPNLRRAARGHGATRSRSFMPEGVRFTRPAGGMFLWVTVPQVDTAELLRISAESKVVFVPGVNFYPARDVHDGMRLNFSNASEKNIRVGVERLAHAIRLYES